MQSSCLSKESERGPRLALDQRAALATPRQIQRQREAHGAAADDQDRRLNVFQLAHNLSA
jgi:hypothetical protein